MLPRSHFSRLFLIICFVSLALPQNSFAQGQASAVLYNVEAGEFPIISGLLDVYNEQGQFERGLLPQNIALLENGKTIPPAVLEERNTPLQVVVAINSNPALAVRDGLGLSRYDKASTVLQNWAAARPAESPDKFSLVWNGGIIASGVNPLTWRNRLELFDLQARTSTSSLAALSFALDITQEAALAPGSKKAILFISSHLDNQNIPAINDLTSRAQLSGVRIFVWIIDSKDFLLHPGSDALRQLASATGGSSLNFSGDETIIDPEEWLDTLRWVYAFEYTSAVRETGEHSLAALVTRNQLSLNSNAITLNLVVEAPNPILISPPSQITRENLQDSFDLENSQPTQYPLEILVEFPDGNPRSLTRAVLYVDDAPVQENITQPFEKFIWNLRSYQASASHTLSVEVTDSLGLSRRSAPISVNLVVIQPPGGWAGLLLKNNTAIVVSAVVFAGIVLLIILFFSGRKTILSLTERRKARAHQLDPVTQPVPVNAEAASKLHSANPFPWMRRKAPPPAAYLVKLTFDGQPGSGDPIALAAPELTVGTDPTQATNVLGDPSLSPLHARLQRNSDGQVLLTDNHSIAGTWVNYELIPQEGCLLAHGDVVNFGKLTYRFVLSKPPAPKKPELLPIKQK